MHTYMHKLKEQYNDTLHANECMIANNVCAHVHTLCNICAQSHCRVFEYEARASAALQQAVVEEERLDKVSKAASMKQELLDTAFKSVKVRGLSRGSTECMHTCVCVHVREKEEGEECIQG